MSQDRVALGLVLIVSSLIIAGAVSGFFSFRYEAGLKSPAERGSFWYLMKVTTIFSLYGQGGWWRTYICGSPKSSAKVALG